MKQFISMARAAVLWYDEMDLAMIGIEDDWGKRLYWGTGEHEIIIL